MSVKDLWIAADLGGPSGVYRYLNGDRGRLVNSQSAEVIEKMAAVLDVEPSYFVEYRQWQVREATRLHAELAEAVYDTVMLIAHNRGWLPKSGVVEVDEPQ